MNEEEKFLDELVRSGICKVVHDKEEGGGLVITPFGRLVYQYLKDWIDDKK